jgi:ParB/RepB/Spo0J family partition protein
MHAVKSQISNLKSEIPRTAKTNGKTQPAKSGRTKAPMVDFSNWGKTLAKAAKKSGVHAKNGALTDVAEAPTEGSRLFDPKTIRRSPFNRDYFEPEALEVLTADVKINGVLQPGIVRPVDPPDGIIAWEIIAGERRWRAALGAGRQYPAMVRRASDLEALEIQAIENMHREDLSPIDEAHKYEQLRAAYEAAGATRTEAVAMICATAGKGPATVYERLVLMKLPSQVIVLTQRGMLPPSHAVLLTRLKDSVTQIDLAQQIIHPKQGEAEEGVMPFRASKALVEKASQREKNLAEWQKQEIEFKAKGLGVLSARQCGEFFDSWEDREYWQIKGAAPYVRDDQNCTLPGANYRTYAKLWKKPPLPILGRLKDGRAVIVYDKELADKFVRAGGKLHATGGSSASGVDREKARAHKQRCEYFKIQLGPIVKKVECDLDSPAFWKFFARLMVGQWRSDPLTRLVKRRGWKSHGDIQQQIETMGVGELRALCTEILLWNDTPSTGGEGWGRGILQACDMFQITLQSWKMNGTPADLQTSRNGEEDDDDEAHV